MSSYLLRCGRRSCRSRLFQGSAAKTSFPRAWFALPRRALGAHPSLLWALKMQRYILPLVIFDMDLNSCLFSILPVLQVCPDNIICLAGGETMGEFTVRI